MALNLRPNRSIVYFKGTMQADIFFIIRFHAIMHRTTVVQNKIIRIICSCIFFVLLICIGLVEPSISLPIRKVWSGRPNPKPLQPLNFYHRSKRKNPFYSELYALQRIKARFSINIKKLF